MKGIRRSIVVPLRSQGKVDVVAFDFSRGWNQFSVSLVLFGAAKTWRAVTVPLADHAAIVFTHVARCGREVENRTSAEDVETTSASDDVVSKTGEEVIKRSLDQTDYGLLSP